MDEPTRDVADVETDPKHAVSTSYGRALGVARMTVGIEVTCEESTHNARNEMVRLLRSLALDIEAGLA